VGICIPLSTKEMVWWSFSTQHLKEKPHPAAGLFSHDRSAQADQPIKQPVKGLATRDEGVGVSTLHDLRGGVEEAPRGPRGKLLVPGGAPLVQHVGDLGGGQCPAVQCAHNHVMGTTVVQTVFAVSTDPAVEVVELVAQLSHRSRSEVPEITDGETGVFPANGHLPAKAEVVADEDTRPRNQSGRVALVMAVPQTHRPSVVLLGTTGSLHGEESEVAGAFVGEGMGFTGNVKASGKQLGLHFAHEGGMGEGIPAGGANWCLHLRNRITAHSGGSAVEEKALGRGGSAGGGWFEQFVHG